VADQNQLDLAECFEGDAAVPTKKAEVPLAAEEKPLPAGSWGCNTQSHLYAVKDSTFWCTQKDASL